MEFASRTLTKAILALIVVFGVSLVASVFSFPLIKLEIVGKFDSKVLMSGYAIIFAAAACIGGLRLGLSRYDGRLGLARRIGELPVGVLCTGLFFGCLALRIAGILLFSQEPYGDPAGHEAAAWSVSQGDGYIRVRHGIAAPDPHWPPGYVYIAAGFYYLFGRSWMMLSVVNCLIDSVTCVLVYHLARRIFGPVAALSAGILYAFNPILIVNTQQIIYAPLFALMICVLTLLITRRRWLVGVLYGLASLVKPIFLVGPVLSAAQDVMERRPPRKVAIRFMIVTALLCVAIAPWTVRNYVVFDRFLPVSANGGWVLWWGNNENSLGGMQKWSSDQMNAYGADLIDLDRRLGRESFEWIAENPVRFLALIPRKQARTWGTESASLPKLEHISATLRFVTRSIVQLFYVAIALLAAMTLISRRWELLRSPEGVMTSFILLLAWAVHSIYIGWSFYHHGFLPLLTIVASAALFAPARAAERDATAGGSRPVAAHVGHGAVAP